MVWGIAALASIALLAACGGRRDGADASSPVDAAADGAPADGAAGDGGGGDGGGVACDGPLEAVHAMVLTGRNSAGYALAEVPRLVAEPRSGGDVEVYAMTPGMPDVLPAPDASSGIAPSDGGGIVAASADGDRLAVLFQRHASTSVSTEVVVAEGGSVLGRAVLADFASLDAEGFALAGDHVAVVGGNGMAELLVRVLAVDGSVRLDMALTDRGDPVVVADGDRFVFALNHRDRAAVELYELTAAGLTPLRDVFTPGPILEVALAGDAVATVDFLGGELLVLGPDESITAHPLPSMEGGGGLVGLRTPLGDAFALQLGENIAFGLIRPEGIVWERGETYGPVGTFMHGDARNAGVYTMHRAGLEPVVEYTGFRCP